MASTSPNQTNYPLPSPNLPVRIPSQSSAVS